jgi:hypothetical protein
MVPDTREERGERDAKPRSDMVASLREFRIANNSETVPLQSCNPARAAIEMTDTRVSKMFAKSP